MLIAVPKSENRKEFEVLGKVTYLLKYKIRLRSFCFLVARYGPVCHRGRVQRIRSLVILLGPCHTCRVITSYVATNPTLAVSIYSFPSHLAPHSAVDSALRQPE